MGLFRRSAQEAREMRDAVREAVGATDDLTAATEGLAAAVPVVDPPPTAGPGPGGPLQKGITAAGGNTAATPITAAGGNDFRRQITPSGGTGRAARGGLRQGGGGSSRSGFAEDDVVGLGLQLLGLPDDDMWRQAFAMAAASRGGVMPSREAVEVTHEWLQAGGRPTFALPAVRMGRGSGSSAGGDGSSFNTGAGSAAPAGAVTQRIGGGKTLGEAEIVERLDRNNALLGRVAHQLETAASAGTLRRSNR